MRRDRGSSSWILACIVPFAFSGALGALGLALSAVHVSVWIWCG